MERVTDTKVCVSLKQDSLNDSPVLDGPSYEVYLRLSHVLPIMMNVFNHYSIRRQVTRDLILLLEKNGRYVWKEQNGYKPITPLNTDLKILTEFLAKHLQLVSHDLIEIAQNYGVKGGSLQNNLHLLTEKLQNMGWSVQINTKYSIACTIGSW